MNLGIAGRHAIVCGASRGLGRACALALAREGVSLTIVARNEDDLEQAAREIAADTGIRGTAVGADINTAEGQATVLARTSDPDILVANPGVRQTPGDFRTLTPRERQRLLDSH